MVPVPWVTAFLAQLAATQCLIVLMALMNRIAKRTTALATFRYNTVEVKLNLIYSALY